TVVSPNISTSKICINVSDYQITSFGSLSTILSSLLNNYPNGVPEGLKTDQLRFAMCGSAPVPAEVMKKFESTFNCPVIEGYGLSESTCRSTFNPPDDRRRAGSCGLPIGNEMKVVDDTDMEVPDGEIDEVLYQHPAVAAAATIGVPDPLYGEEVAAFIVLRDGMKVSEEELISHCQAELADYKCPKSIRILSEIPKGPTGKLLKRELARIYAIE